MLDVVIKAHHRRPSIGRVSFDGVCSESTREDGIVSLVGSYEMIQDQRTEHPAGTPSLTFTCFGVDVVEVLSLCYVPKISVLH